MPADLDWLEELSEWVFASFYFLRTIGQLNPNGSVSCIQNHGACFGQILLYKAIKFNFCFLFQHLLKVCYIIYFHT